MSDKTAVEMFVEDGEFNWAKFRGAFKKYVKEVDGHGGIADKRPVLRTDHNIVAIWVKEFDSWLDGKLDNDWHDWRNERNLFPQEKEVIKEYLESNDIIETLVEDNTVVYVEGEGEVGTVSEYYNGNNGGVENGKKDADGDTAHDESGEKDSDSGDNSDGSVGSDDDGGSDDTDGVDYSGRFENMVEIGFMTPDKEIQKAKIRGAMKKFSHEVDEVVGTKEEPNAEEAKEAFNRWMMDKFGNEWGMFIHDMLDPGQLRSMGEAMWEKNEEYKETVKRKWEHDPEQLEGNGDRTNGSESDKSAGGNSISDWASMDNGSDGEDVGESEEDEGDSGEDGGGKHKSDRYRFRQFSEIKADKDEMWDVDDIRNEIIRENVWTALDKIPTNSVDMVVTSPPYWNLRDYDGGDFAPIGGDPECNHKFNNGKCYKCDAWKGQLGREPEPQMFVENIVSIFQKIRRILKPTGSLFLNIGDTFAGQKFTGDLRAERKSMMMIPDRVYVKMLDLDWVLRQKIIWAKQVIFNDDTVHGATNPTSVKDRINYTHEPLYWFTNSPDYYSDIYAVRREPKTDEQDMANYEGKYDEDEIDDEMYNSPTARAAREGYEPSFYHDAGANIPDVWRVPTGSAGKEHPAVFSPELPKRPIQMTCPKFVCANCGTPHQRVVEDGESQGFEKDCRCDTDERENGIVFEPFCGRGTTAKAAEDEGRDWITTEVSDKYADFAEDYITGAKKTELGDFA